MNTPGMDVAEVFRGLTILNLGCGYKTTPYTTDIDFSVQQRLHASRLGRVAARIAVRGERRVQFEAMDDDLVVHDLRKGIPAGDGTVDVVYHSHVLEHIDREHVPGFFREIERVLRPGGVHRIVVPDLEFVVRRYLDHLDQAGPDHATIGIAPILGQCVRREASGTSKQGPVRRRIENLILGDARRRGETHQWMYDRLCLAQTLEAAGFVGVQQMDVHTSQVPGWDLLGLDLSEDRESAHKPNSLYMEARKAGPPRFEPVEAVEMSAPPVG